MARKRFNRHSVASSSGNYVRIAHYRLLQEGLEERGFKEELKDIAEVEVRVAIKRQNKYAVKVFGKLMFISENDALKLNPELVIRF